MSTIYPDLQNNFPDSIDDFYKFTDPSISQIAIINQYYSKFQSGDISGAAEILESNPDLKTAILNAERLNKIRDGIISIERFYLDDVQQYLVNIVKNKGDWNSQTKYTKYDVVFYEIDGIEQAFMGLDVNIPIGTLPTDDTYWIPLTLRGKQGESGIGLTPRGEWNSSTEYYINDCVSYKNKLWYAKQSSTNKIPDESNEYWEYIAIIDKQVISSSEEPQNQSPGDVWIEETGGDL